MSSTALGDVTSPDGWIYVGACNPGQDTHLPGFDNYLEALACVSGRDTLGTNTKTTLGLIRQNACDVDNTSDQITCARNAAARRRRATAPDPRIFNAASDLCREIPS